MGTSTVEAPPLVNDLSGDSAPYNVFEDHSTGWDANRLMLAYWSPAQAYAVKQWSRLLYTRANIQQEDLRMCADEALIKITGIYFDWCTEHDKDPDARGIFWKMLTQKIDWMVLNFNTLRSKNAAYSLEQMEGDDEHLPDSDYVATQIARYRPASILHRQIIDIVALAPTRQKVILALRFFEEMPTAEMGRLFGVSRISIAEALTPITQRIMATARNLVVTAPEELPQPRKVTPFEPTEALNEWLLARYGTTDLHAYLGYVTLHYYADVTYAIDILNRAHGKYISPSKTSTPSKLTPEQWAEVDARLLAGETKIAIAKDFGITDTTISARVTRGAR